MFGFLDGGFGSREGEGRPVERAGFLVFVGWVEYVLRARQEASMSMGYDRQPVSPRSKSQRAP